MAEDAVKTVRIATGKASYDALIGGKLLSRLGKHLRGLVQGPRCAIVADTNTGALFSQEVERSLEAAGFVPIVVTVPAGESSKSLEQAGSVCDAMAAAGLDRSSFVVALGGGVVGDLAGFAAAIYHRGIPYVQGPTTLLAQVDSSIGGKTAVNTVAGKNLLGAVHQPVLVVADTDTLKTLPPREFNQGFAEIIKHAIIADTSLFNLLVEVDLTELVRRNIEIKAAVVAQDEHDDAGVRAVLNFGHTVGHAIERAAGYGVLLHGEAISLGIMAACEVSVRRAGLSEDERQQVLSALRKFHLPTQLPLDFPRAAILPAVLTDKKFARGEGRFVVTPRFGSAYLTSDVTIADIEAAISVL
ncbi:MAG: 3-dehydroquinate synthase [Chthoniobacterales bacterium]